MIFYKYIESIFLILFTLQTNSKILNRTKKYKAFHNYIIYEILFSDKSNSKYSNPIINYKLNPNYTITLISFYYR